MSQFLDLQFIQCEDIAKLILYGISKGYRFKFGEGLVAITDAADGDYDGPHMKDGAHYNDLGNDLLLFIDGVNITTDHPAWHDLGSYWKSLNPLHRWGGDFKIRDYDHFSTYYQGIA